MSDNSIFYVYIHRRNDTNDVFYVGKGKAYRAWTISGRSVWWKSIVDKCGFSVEIIENNLTEDDAFDLEVETIKFYRDCGYKLCNMSDGGQGGGVGAVRTEDVKMRISKAMTGRKLSENTKNKIRLARLGTKMPTVSGDERDAINKKRSATREINLQQGLTNIKTVCCSNGMRFISTRHAVEWCKAQGYLSAASSAICNCCNGKNKTAYGFMWYYECLEKENNGN